MRKYFITTGHCNCCVTFTVQLRSTWGQQHCHHHQLYCFHFHQTTISRTEPGQLNRRMPSNLLISCSMWSLSPWSLLSDISPFCNFSIWNMLIYVCDEDLSNICSNFNATPAEVTCFHCECLCVGCRIINPSTLAPVDQQCLPCKNCLLVSHCCLNCVLYLLTLMTGSEQQETGWKGLGLINYVALSQCHNQTTHIQLAQKTYSLARAVATSIAINLRRYSHAHAFKFCYS